MTFLGPYLAAAALLVLAGAAKAWRPDDTARAVRSLLPRLGLPAARRAVRVLASMESIAGLYALALPGRPAGVLVAASYAAFTAVVLVARRRGGVLASCGCFGRPDTPPTWLHACTVAALSALSVPVAATAGHQRVVWSLLAGTPLHGVAMALLVVVATSVGYLLLVGLPRLQAGRAPVHTPEAAG